MFTLHGLIATLVYLVCQFIGSESINSQVYFINCHI